MKRTINFGAADLKDGPFEIFEEDEYFGEELPSLWMRVVNLPRVLESYEGLWALGIMFGAGLPNELIWLQQGKILFVISR